VSFTQNAFDEELEQATAGLRAQLAAALARVAELEQELADVHALEEAACRLGTDTGVPSQIPGFEPDGSDHPHFVLMPIGARSRRAAVEYLKKEGKDG
jgi:hypothetical protein